MSWKEQEQRKQHEAEQRRQEEERKKAQVLHELKAEREASNANTVELHGARNQGETARYGGGGEVKKTRLPKMAARYRRHVPGRPCRGAA